MSINLHNYESWFQLYVDGELDTQQMLAVEAFTQKHPDLELVLEQLMQTILEPPTITMPGKHLLLKPEEWDADNLENWQQDLLLRLDGESKNKEALPAKYTREWSRLQATVLQSEAISMANKDRLMSHNMHRTPVIAMSWVKRIAVAAAVAVLIWGVWPADNISGNNSNELAKTAVGQQANGVAAKKAGSNDRQVTPAGTDKGNNVETASFSQNEDAGNEKGTVAKSNPATPPAPVQYAAITELDVVTHTPIENNQVNIDVLTPDIDTREVGASTEIVAALSADQQHYPEFLIDEEYLGNNDDADEMVNIGGIKVKKNKIRGILRSVSRNVTRRTTTENIQEAIFPK